MAGIGAAPKEKGQRRRANTPTRGEWVDLESTGERNLPPLEGEYEQRILDIWDAWSRDPVSAQWEPGDLDYALDTIELRATKWPQKADEIRRRYDALGLTPKGKRDLRWRITKEVSASTPKRESAGPRRRAHLTAVA